MFARKVPCKKKTGGGGKKKDTTIAREKSFNVNHSSPRHCSGPACLSAAHSTTKSSILFELNTMYSLSSSRIFIYFLGFPSFKNKTKQKKKGQPLKKIFSFVGHRANKERRIWYYIIWPRGVIAARLNQTHRKIGRRIPKQGKHINCDT